MFLHWYSFSPDPYILPWLQHSQSILLTSLPLIDYVFPFTLHRKTSNGWRGKKKPFLCCLEKATAKFCLFSNMNRHGQWALAVVKTHSAMTSLPISVLQSPVAPSSVTRGPSLGPHCQKLVGLLEIKPKKCEPP